MSGSDHEEPHADHHEEDDSSKSSAQKLIEVIASHERIDAVHEAVDELCGRFLTNNANRDAFSRSLGLEAILLAFESLLSAQLSAQTRPEVSAQTQSLSFAKLCKLLSTALQEHRGNERYFARRLRGWQTLGDVFRKLISHASALDAGDQASTGEHEQLASAMLSLTSGLSTSGSPKRLENAQAAAILLGGACAGADSQSFNASLAELLAACLDNISNQVALWNSGITHTLLKRVLASQKHSSNNIVHQIFHTTSHLGFKDLDDAALLFKAARKDDSARDMLLDILKRSKQPAFVQLDLTKHGYSSIELPALPRTFPPSGGYSFSAWLRFDNFDPNCHTTIFGLFDPSQTCFVLAYLERDTHQLILQTSVKSARPSVRFKSTIFESKRWYHVAVVHRKTASDTKQSSASLFVDGDFAEHVKCTYPEGPPITKDARGFTPQGFAETSPVQAFLGTPRDLAFKLGRDQTSSQWSICSMHLFQVPLSDEFIAVQYRLGQRYTGNFQDCLGPLLTYRSSAELNRYNELLHPDKSEKSDIVRATEQRGSDVIPESKILFSFSPRAVIHMDDPQPILTIADLSHKAAEKYKKLATKASAVALNTAISSISEAVARQYGTVILTGDPVVAVPSALDDASWCIGGSLAPLYKLLEMADTGQAALKAVQIFLECVKDNWRISESMEKHNGYGVLSILIREKLGLDLQTPVPMLQTRKPLVPLPSEQRADFAFEALKAILDFVGYDSLAPEKSMIINPMAYRMLLIDFDTWRRCDLAVVSLYYVQFDHFCHHNQHQAFNQKRLGRMRVARKLLDAMKVEDVLPEHMDGLLLALRRLVDGGHAQNAFKDLAMFVAFGLQEERVSIRSAAPSTMSGTRTRHHAASLSFHGRNSGTSTPGSVSEEHTSRVSRSQLALRTLGLVVESLCEQNSASLLRKFLKAVPTRWLSHMLSETDIEVVLLDLRIISQALVILGQEFKHAFADKNGGLTAMRARLKGFWQTPEVWRLCFAMFLGSPSSTTDRSDFTVFNLLRQLKVGSQTRVVNPEMSQVLFAMLEAGLRAVVKEDEPSAYDVMIVETVIRILNELYLRSQAFRDFASTSTYVQELLFVLYPVVVGSDRLSADTEFKAEKDTLSFKGEEVTMRPHSNSLGERPPSVRSLNLDNDIRTPSPRPRRIAAGPRRLSSFVLVNGGSGNSNLPAARFTPVLAAKSRESVKLNVGNSIVESLLEICINLFIEQICNKKDFNGIGLFQKVPAGFKEHQAYFESYILVHTITQLWTHLQLNERLLQDTKVLTNLSRFCQHIAEAVFEGWFIEGAQPVIDFIGKVLEYLQQPHIAEVKTVRLCSQAVNAMRVVFLRVTLLRLSELDESADEAEAVAFLQQMCYWQTILFSSENQETLFTKLICFLLYLKLTSPFVSVRMAAATLWRLVLMQKPTETATLLTVSMGSNQRHLSSGFMRLVQVDDDDFIKWIDDNRTTLDSVLIEALAKPWADFVADENRRNEETARSRLLKRREKLRQWQQDESSADEFLHRFELSTNHWRSNIYSQERLKSQRALQDHQEAVSSINAAINRLEKQLSQPAGLDSSKDSPQWRLDLTEGPNRMRMRLFRDKAAHKQVFQSKRKASELKSARRLTLNTRVPEIKHEVPTPSSYTRHMDGGVDPIDENGHTMTDSISGSQLLEGGFEMIEDPKEDEDGFVEDKNRKVMTSLQRGDMVQQLYNVSRIIGLEACEGLLIIGKKCLYMQDNFFQRSDGEIVGVAQAPADERDPYLQLISGKDVGTQTTKNSTGDQSTRHWTWTQVLSVSKRRFLLRNVSVEVFFSDGRSYLLTCLNTKIRDSLYNAVVGHAPHVHSKLASAGEDSWRLDSLRNPEEVPSTLGSKFANVFSGGSGYVATKSWTRGEMSNFQYLMLVNTLAGRSFNDLTQYPVFPWVLADYHSEELDLRNPRTFRDLSKPMGCQSPAREAEFRDRYKQFAEMSDQSAPAFNYGTHYSSAMIVSSYLIRLQPFVQTYLLLQGGSFDHADRLFDSIEKAWLSASRDNMSDVRELTPEFFYLPEFLTNANQYDFGYKQADGGSVNDVQLPPWAKDDPHLFIAKHREALESPYVSSQLHHWIDLVFGFKQRGEAAIAATNVFQHLSYGGAKDLDTIDDPVERLATIGIIHSFGQTPHQVFNRPHPDRDTDQEEPGRLDAETASLVRLPSPLFESAEKVSRLVYSKAQERLLCCGPGKANLMPACDRYMQWRLSDNSLRFYSSNSKRLVGMYENTHIGPITDTCFADSKTLITAGADCTLSVWNLISRKDWVELQAQTCLFGHRTAISMVLANRAWSTILSVSQDGQALLWDLNRYNCIRELRSAGDEAVSSAAIDSVNGRIMLCVGADVLLYTLNGHLLLRQRVCESDQEVTSSCAFYDGSHNEWSKWQVLFTGHSHGIANAWSLTTLSDGAWHLQLVHRLNHVDASREDGANISSNITAILPMPTAVYTGDDRGKVWQWDVLHKQGMTNGRET